MIRIVFFAFSLIIALPVAASTRDDISMCWQDFLSLYVTHDGRVIDWQNNQISHSEGQGYAMLAAVLNNDHAAFEKVFTWSNNNLGQGLRAWKWGKGEQGWHILDTNNATDGDMLHAWALFLAGERWNISDYTAAALHITTEIRNKLIKDNGLLLPGINGFLIGDKIKINPSYYIFPALKDFIRFDPDNAATWKAVYKQGINIIKKSVQKHSGLVPDWVRCDLQGKILPPESPPQFGYEAIRIPLYLSLAGEKSTARLFVPLLLQVAKTEKMDAVTCFDASPCDLTEAMAGYYAVLARTASLLTLDKTASVLWRLAEKRKQTQKGNYYGTVLYLMALVHLHD